MDMTLNETSLTFNLLGEQQQITFNCGGAEGMDFTLQTPQYLSTGIYGGITQIDPDFEGLILNTAHKVINKDITINPIQVETVSNMSGGSTVYIGGII